MPCVNEGGDIGASQAAGSSVIPIVPTIKSKVAIAVIAKPTFLNERLLILFSCISLSKSLYALLDFLSLGFIFTESRRFSEADFDFCDNRIWHLFVERFYELPCLQVEVWFGENHSRPISIPEGINRASSALF